MLLQLINLLILKTRLLTPSQKSGVALVAWMSSATNIEPS